MIEPRVNRLLRWLYILRLSMKLGWSKARDLTAYRLCSDCFSDHGLRLTATQIGLVHDVTCPNCRSRNGRKLTLQLLHGLAYRFFVWGTLHRSDYGAVPVVQFNASPHADTFPEPVWPKADMRLIEDATDINFFHYEPRFWMLGLNIEPLDALKDPFTRASTIQRIFREFPDTVLRNGELFYRLRKNVERPQDTGQFDTRPASLTRHGRLDSERLPVMYASSDLHICVHECRVTAEDDSYVATLAPNRDLRILDLTAMLSEPHATEFETLDLTIHMLFLAGEHSYEICRSIAQAASDAGYDGLAYPSYFSLIKSGHVPFETTYGISHRRISQLAELEKSKIAQNLALFGRPLKQRTVRVECINRLVLRKVSYDYHFGPAVS
ncbi:MAG: RES domain-containing protein [Rhodospirillaceae bacterium]|nr:RES domain-containing protein [Rhodospirillaceae bacterium]